jgi:hypothetical protein
MLESKIRKRLETAKSGSNLFAKAEREGPKAFNKIEDCHVLVESIGGQIGTSVLPCASGAIRVACSLPEPGQEQHGFGVEFVVFVLPLFAGVTFDLGYGKARCVRGQELEERPKGKGPAR